MEINEKFSVSISSTASIYAPLPEMSSVNGAVSSAPTSRTTPVMSMPKNALIDLSYVLFRWGKYIWNIWDVRSIFFFSLRDFSHVCIPSLTCAVFMSRFPGLCPLCGYSSTFERFGRKFPGLFWFAFPIFLSSQFKIPGFRLVLLVLPPPYFWIPFRFSSHFPVRLVSIFFLSLPPC